MDSLLVILENILGLVDRSVLFWSNLLKGYTNLCELSLLFLLIFLIYIPIFFRKALGNFFVYALESFLIYQ